jgi:oligopeptide/dipeptide ABC transporter ATP-binding protein
MRQGLNDATPLLVVEGLTKDYETKDARLRSRIARAVDGVDFAVDRGETFAIVGESGSGKSTVGRVLLGLYPATGGTALLEGTDLLALDAEEFRGIRNRIQMVFQDPLASFDPRATVRQSLRPFALLGGHRARADQDREIDAAAVAVGLDPALVDRLPSKVSGGQLQRLSVARALLAGPDLVFLDEPTSALDVSIRGQVVNLLLDLQQQQGVSYLLVAHDLRVVYSMAHQVAVMYLGQFVEVAPRDRLYDDPRHPYTRGLLHAANLELAQGAREVVRLSGELSDDDARRPGCRLVPRCPFAEARCEEPQPLVQLSPGHLVRCWKSVEQPEAMGLAAAGSAPHVPAVIPSPPSDTPKEQS